jgi:bacillithiol synthase
LHQNSFPTITKQIEELGVHYKIQAHPRETNLFYLNDQLRERIERKGDKWVILNTDIQWTKGELLTELKQHPERFSPNVMLRGLYQETILPNVAFVGGGAEVAYWMQLRTVFEHYKVFYPTVLLRQSVLWIGETQAKLRQQMGLSSVDIFKPELDLIHEYIAKHSTDDWQTNEERKAIEAIFADLKQKASDLDPTLRSSAEAALTKMRHQLTVLEKKMQTQLSRITRLKTVLFPANSLQERVENFSEYYLQYGPSFFDTIKDGINALEANFLVIE